MANVKLQQLVDQERATHEDDAHRHAVWAALASVEPALADEILALFSTVDAAARWVTTPSSEKHGSPAKRVAAGQVADLRAALRKTAHGFVA